MMGGGALTVVMVVVMAVMMGAMIGGIAWAAVRRARRGAASRPAESAQGPERGVDTTQQ